MLLMPDDSMSNTHAADLPPERAEAAFVFSRSFQHLQHARRRGAWRTDGLYGCGGLLQGQIKARKKKNGLRKYTQAIQGHLAAVAVGSARTELSANMRLMGRLFEQGVPADDDTCVRMMRALPPYGEIDLDISDVFKLELVALPADAAKDLDEVSGRHFPQCDAYGGDEEAFEADFSEIPRQATAEWA